MKKFLFLLMSVAVLSASAGINKAPMQKNVAKIFGSKNKMEQVARKSATPLVAKPVMFKAAAKADVPEGYASVTLTAPDVWGDGTGYQMLLDADATAYGTIIPETGGLTTSGDASAATYAEFEYKIPENADGSLSTTNIILENSVTILIPAGTYDWCITNPTPGDRMWIASTNGNVGGRADDYVFKSGVAYEFVLSVYGSNDGVDVTIDDPNAPVVPVVEVTPAATSAYVDWPADANAEGYDLRWRPWTDMSGAGYEWHFTLESYADDIQGWWVYDADGDSLTWELNYTSSAQEDVCLFSQSWDYYEGDLTPDNYIGTPDVPLKGELKFTMWGPSDSWPDHVQVYAMVGEDLYQLFEEDLQTTSEHVTYTVDLSAFEGAEGCIVFRHYNCTGMYYVYLDDICIGETIEPAPWNYVYGITDDYYNIEGLTPETKYEVEVMAYKGNDETDWSETVEFTTLAELKDVYMLGGDDQPWDPTQGTKFTYDAENNIYTLNYTFPAEYSYFGFTTELAENNDDGGWTYIEPFRFGAIADEGNDYWYTGEEDYISLTWDAYHAIRIPAGEYNMTIDLEAMRLIIEPVTPAGLRGDVNMDNNVSIADVTALIDYLLSHDATGISVANADCNLDENVSIADVTALIDYLLSHAW